MNIFTLRARRERRVQAPLLRRAQLRVRFGLGFVVIALLVHTYKNV